METLWNGDAGRAWVDAQELLDGLFKPFEAYLVDAVSSGSAACVADVGCGTGRVTLAIARRLGARGRVVGVDISEAMVAAARARARREGSSATFVHAHAAFHEFEPASLDMIVSRFGVMFFDDPVAAFANLRRASKDAAELRVIVWRSAEENPFMTAAERAAAPLLPDLPARELDAPGQFAFGDARRVRRILEESGWAGIDIRPLDVVCALPERDLSRYLARLGPVGRLLQQKDAGTQARVLEAIRPAFDCYLHDNDVRFTAACWMVTGQRRL